MPKQKNVSEKSSWNSSKEYWEQTLSLLSNLFEAILSEIKPNVVHSLSEWSDEYRYLSSSDSAEPGRWKTSRAQYQKGIMDAISDPLVHTVAWMKPSQVGWTAILGNAIGYFVTQEPCSMLLIQPTVETAEAWSKERLAPMIEEMPILKDVISDPKSRDGDNTIRMKSFPGGFLAIVGANAPSGLASRPIRIVLCDEVDRWPESAGSEGDPLKLAARRQITFWNRKTLIGSTPVRKGYSVIEREYEKGDKRVFLVPCHECGHAQRLQWSQVKWAKGEKGEHLPETARYQCINCGDLWSDEDRWTNIGDGEWHATAPFNGIASFKNSAIDSTWMRLEEIVTEFLDCKGNPELLKVWTNTLLGEPFEAQGERVDAKGLKANIENYDVNDLPDNCHFATMGVDVQGDRLECEVVGWGLGDESWGIEYRVIMGDPARKETWKVLDEIRRTRYWTSSGRLIRIRATAVDTGGHHGQQVINYCSSKPATENCYPIKGASGTRPVWPKRASKTGRTKDNIYLVGVDTAKDTIYARFRFVLPSGVKSMPGYCHLPNTYGDEWFEQATSEVVVTKLKMGKPFRYWDLPAGKRNEALDCRVYAYAAMMSLLPSQKHPSKVKIEQLAAIKAPPVTRLADEQDDEVMGLPRPPSVAVAKRRTGRKMRSRGIEL